MSSENLLYTNECVICFDPIEIDIKKEKINIFKECNHSYNYHIICVNNWIKECTDKNIKPTCPVCRNEMVNINIQYIEETTNNKSFKYFVFITSVIIITIFINYNL